MHKAARVLLVDRDQQSLKLMEKILKNRGVYVIKAIDGEQALKILNSPKTTKEPFNAVITRLHMPFVNGFELSKQIFSKYPVVIVKGESNVSENKFISFCDSCIDKVDMEDYLYDATVMAMKRHRLGLSVAG